MSTYNTRLFTWNKNTNTFSTEASDLPGYVGGMMFKLESKKTGALLFACHVTVHTDREGDVTHWTYDLHNDQRKLTGIKVIVFND